MLLNYIRTNTANYKTVLSRVILV